MAGNDVTIHVKAEDHASRQMGTIGKKVEVEAKRSFLKVGGHSGAAFAAGFLKTITFGQLGSGFAMAATKMAPKMAHVGGVLGAGLAAGLVMQAVKAVGALLPLGLGAAFAAMPVIHLLKTKDFKDDIKELKKSWKSFITSVAEPFEVPLEKSMKAVGEWMEKNKKLFKGISKEIAPALEGLTKGALKGITNFLKEIDWESVGAGMKAWGDAMPGIGKSLGKLVDKILQDPEGTVDAVKGLAKGIEDIGKAAGKAWENLEKFTEAYDGLASFIDEQENSNLGGDSLLLPKPETIRKQAAAVLKALTNFASGAKRRFGQVKDSGAEMVGDMRSMGSRVAAAVRSMASRVATALSSMASRAAARASTMRSQVVSRFNSMRSAVSSAVSSAASAVASRFSSMMSRARSTVSSGAARVVAVMRSLGARIRGAFAGAAGWLVNAGRAIVSGLIRGIGQLASSAATAAAGVVRRAAAAARAAIPGLATGGYVGGLAHAAEGGPRGGAVLVGEHGPEVVNLPYGSHVNSNPDSQRMMATGRGQGNITINVNAPNYVGAPSDLLRALVDAKRRGQLDVILR